jgi:hypothetical protein
MQGSAKSITIHKPMAAICGLKCIVVVVSWTVGSSPLASWPPHDRLASASLSDRGIPCVVHGLGNCLIACTRFLFRRGATPELPDSRLSEKVPIMVTSRLLGSIRFTSEQLLLALAKALSQPALLLSASSIPAGWVR